MQYFLKPTVQQFGTWSSESTVFSLATVSFHVLTGNIAML